MIANTGQALSLLAATLLCLLALATALNKHRSMMRYFARVIWDIVTGVVWIVSFGRTEAPSKLRRAQMRRRQKARLKQLEAEDTDDEDEDEAPTWRSPGRASAPADDDDDLAPPPLNL